MTSLPATQARDTGSGSNATCRRLAGASRTKRFPRFRSGARITAQGPMALSTAVGRRPPWVTFSVLNSHRSEDLGSKVGRWPRFGPATVLKDIALMPVMGGPWRLSGRHQDGYSSAQKMSVRSILDCQPGSEPHAEGGSVGADHGVGSRLKIPLPAHSLATGELGVPGCWSGIRDPKRLVPC